MKNKTIGACRYLIRHAPIIVYISLSILLSQAPYTIDIQQLQCEGKIRAYDNTKTEAIEEKTDKKGERYLLKKKKRTMEEGRKAYGRRRKEPSFHRMTPVIYMDDPGHPYRPLGSSIQTNRNNCFFSTSFSRHGNILSP